MSINLTHNVVWIANGHFLAVTTCRCTDESKIDSNKLMEFLLSDPPMDAVEITLIFGKLNVYHYM